MRRTFGGVVAVDGVDLVVGPSEIVGIIGPNGAGKTTLFDLVSGALPADAGQVVLGGVDVTTLDAVARARVGLARTFQDARLFPALTVAETIAVALDREAEVRDPLALALRIGAAVRSEATVAGRVDELLVATGLGAHRDTFVAELSTGARHLLDLACVLAGRPSVILLDEPSSGIAQREAEAMAPVLRRLRDDTGAAVVVVEHDLDLVAAVADRLVALVGGRVVADGEPADVLADPEVVRAYLGRAPGEVLVP